MSKIFFDSNLFIYLVEDYGDLSKRVSELRVRMLARNDQLYTSTLTLGEVLVKPVGINDEEGIQRFVQTLTATSLLVSFDQKASLAYASIRQDRSIKAPDAIQLACAASVGIDLFITNDNRLAKKSVSGIQFITSLEGATSLMEGE